MKKIFLGLFVLIAVFSFTVVLVKAEETSVALADGVQIRTDGNNGLRWEATVTNPEEGQVYGFLFAQGELTAEQLNKDTANVVAKEVEGLKEDGKYHATMVKFPKDAAVQDITVRAYVRTGEEYEYSENVVTRNLAEVAVYSKNTAGGEFVDEVVEYVAENYKKTFEDNNKTLYYDNAIYETNHLALAEAFIKDWNATLGTSLDPKTAFVTNSYDSPFRKSARSGGTDATTSGLYKFFNNEVMSAKWGWILDYILAELNTGTGYSACKYQIQVIRGAENTDTSSWYYGFNTISFLQSIFNAKGSSAGSGQFRFENDHAKLATIINYNNKIYANYEYSTFVTNNGEVNLPEIADKNGYADCWTFNSTEYLGGAKFTLTPENSYALVSKYTPITYSITYFDGNEQLNLAPATYTVETATFTLPEYVKNGYVFNGWYTTPTFEEGSKVTEIALGSYGDIELYAKTTASSNVPVQVTYDLNGGYFAAEYYLENNTTTDFVGGAYNAIDWTNYGKYISLGTSGRAWWYHVTLNETAIPGVYVVTGKGSSGSTAATLDCDIAILYADQHKTNLPELFALCSGLKVGQLVAISNIPESSTTKASINVSVFDASKTVATLGENLTVDYTLPTTLLVPVREGYTFLGWKSSVDGSIVTEFPGYTANPGAITYTAQWQAE